MLPDKKYWLPIGLSLFLCTLLWLTMGRSARDQDELYYSNAGNGYAAWFENSFRGGIDAYWSASHEHPAFGKLIGGIASRLLVDSPDALELLKVFRLQNILYCFALCFVMYLWVQELSNRGYAVVAVVLTFFLPRFYYYAHVGTLDYPLTVLTFVSCYAFWKGLRNPRIMIACSFLTGLTVSTKINGVFLFAFLGIWLLIAWRNELRQRLWYIVSFAAIPPALFVALWPWLWRDPVARIVSYFVVMKTHFQVPAYYLARTYIKDIPWHYPFVMLLVTLPVAVLLAVGVYALRTRMTATKAFLALSALLPVALIAFLSPLKYDGIRLILPSLPFVCVLATLGMYEFGKSPARRVVVACILALSAVFAVAEYGGYEDFYLNEGVLLSKTAMYFETDYRILAWPPLLPWLKTHSKAKLYFGLPPTKADPQQADYIILHYGRVDEFNETAMEYYMRQTPVYVIKSSRDDVTPIGGIYCVIGARR
jgi:4-amino-4-deoxy-L-arabinose transferase-like glycosyltransferase